MGLLSRITSSRDELPATPGLWRKAPFSAHAAGEEMHLVRTRAGLPLLVPSFAVDFVFGCRKFRPLETHVAEHAAMHAWGPLQVESLRSWLPQMIEGGLLISDGRVLELCRQRGESYPAPGTIAAIGFPTGGDRLPILSRAVESFAANLHAHGRTADLLVADSSADPAHGRALRERAAELARTTGASVLYAGHEQKQRYAAALVRRSGCDPAAVEFALCDPLGLRFLCGANRNAILLHNAGRMCCSVDDDVVCQLAPAPATQHRLALFSAADPMSRWTFLQREHALTSEEFAAQDFLAAHESLLGREVGELFGGEFTVADLDVENAGEGLLRRLETAPADIRTTFTGHVGDPGIPTSAYFLYYTGENRRRFTAEESHYRAAFHSRNVRGRVAAPAIGDSSVCPGMAIGLDLRTLLPPFIPVLHAEDFVFGATVWQCCGRSVAGHLPLAIVHDPPVGKPILPPSALGPENRAVIFEFAHLMRRVILDHIPPEEVDAATRTVRLGRFLSERAEQTPADFMEFIRHRVLDHQGEQIEWLTEQLKEDDEAPDYWRQDVEAYLDQARAAATYEDFDIPYDLKPGRSLAEARELMQRLFAEFGRLLEQWPAIFEAAREMNTNGERMFVA